MLLFALARPERTVAVPAEQARIVLATDTSGSMQATDVEPTRLAAVKKAGQRLPRPGAAARCASAPSSSTTARSSPRRRRSTARLVREVIDDMEPRGGTATGDALQVALDALKGRAGERRPPGAIVLLSDGKATSRPRSRARRARRRKQLKIPIYTVALGTPEGTIQVSQRGGTTRTEQVPPDVADACERIAETLGRQGRTTIDDAGELDDVYKKLGSQVALKDEKREVTAWLAGAGAGAAGGGRRAAAALVRAAGLY